MTSAVLREKPDGGSPCARRGGLPLASLFAAVPALADFTLAKAPQSLADWMDSESYLELGVLVPGLEGEQRAGPPGRQDRRQGAAGRLHGAAQGRLVRARPLRLRGGRHVLTADEDEGHGKENADERT